MERLCRICNVTKPMEGFKPDKTCANGYRHTCNDCFKESQRLRHHASKADQAYMDRLKAARRKHDLKRHYGISDHEYHGMLEAQGGKCWICRSDPGARLLAVDHCHATGKIRGLLCVSCNHGLGKFRDSPDLLSRAIDYINK